jgi:hypothetical protein
MRACENLSVFIHILIVLAKCKCSINDSIKSEYPFIKGVNVNAECTLCNAKFFIAHGGRSDVLNQFFIVSRFLGQNENVPLKILWEP